MDIQQEIINAIEVFVDKRIDSLDIGKDIPTVIKSIRGTQYEVSINGQSYWVDNGIGLVLTVNQPVWVRNPGTMAKAYICAARFGTSTSGNFMTVDQATALIISKVQELIQQGGYVTKADVATEVSNQISKQSTSVNISTDITYEPLD